MTVDLNDFASTANYDVIVVGAGFAGLDAIHHYRQAGLRVEAFDAASGVGGTWYWNRYPGARVDIESLEYSYGFSNDLQQQWPWPERYSAQPDILRYLNWVADRLDLKRSIQFDTRVEAAEWDGDVGVWRVSTSRGQTVTSNVLVMAVGFLSEPNWPDVPGYDKFTGSLVHTGQWPDAGVELAGKRVAIVGTAASAIQIVPTIAPDVDHLYVCQRTAQWCFPMSNEPMPPEYEAYVKSIYPALRRMEYEDRGPGVVLVNYEPTMPSDDRVIDKSREEVEETFEFLWDKTFLHVANRFADLLTERGANDLLREFMARKIRQIVTDPAVADLLTPTEHGPYTRRPPGDYGYYATFNRENVTLVDVRSDPLTSVTKGGLQLGSGRELDVDVIICATGFDAGSGCLTAIPIRGRDGVTLMDYWASGARTYLGMASSGFPNLFFLNAIQSPSAVYSPPLLSNWQNQYILRVLRAMTDRGARTVEVTKEAERDWIEEVRTAMDATLIPQTDSWWTGVNVPGKPRQPVIYLGGFSEYRRLAEVGLEGFSAFETVPSQVPA